MPSYTYIDDSGNEDTMYCSWSTFEEFLKNNPTFKQKLSAPLSISMTGDVMSKTPDVFKDRIKEIQHIYGKKNTNINI